MCVFHFLFMLVFRNELRNWNAHRERLDNFCICNRSLQVSVWSLCGYEQKPVDTKERYKGRSTSSRINKYMNGPTDTETEAKRVSWWGKPCHREATRRRGTCPVFRSGSNVTIGKYRGGNGNGVSRFARAYFYVSPGNHRCLFLFSFSSLSLCIVPLDTRTHTWSWLSTPLWLPFYRCRLSFCLSLYLRSLARLF